MPIFKKIVFISSCIAWMTDLTRPSEKFFKCLRFSLLSRHMLLSDAKVTVALYFILLPQVLLLTFDQNDFLSTSLCRRTSVANANGIAYPVTRAGAVALSSSLSLSNTLFVLPLCNKLLFVGEATKNCMQC
ncbi:hypothetical protein L3X38_010709 [Prunus dulcis]|uniref:Uncharacterized protein n=1 Tax=Prunus dulcis TaxID=3755 RepID=A0AAD4ZF05_PRUDU|nr:hypothetical protein L3X38_010709 [Prunus dulcis]